MTGLSVSEMALRYASFGWLVIPVMGKRPVGADWQKRATADQAQVAKLFATCQHDGVGVQLGQQSGLIDFDCDSDEAEATLQQLFEDNIPTVPTFQSGRGLHRLFKWSPSIPGDSIKIVIDGLEIRTGNGGKGCQTVFPPSGERRWLIDSDDSPAIEIPPNIIERIQARYAEIHNPKTLVHQQPTQIDYSHTEGFLNVPKWLAKHGRDIIGRTEGSDGNTRFHIECPGIASHSTTNSWRDCCITQDSSGKLGGGCFHASCGMQDWHALKNIIGSLDWRDYREEITRTGPIADPFDQETRENSETEPRISGQPVEDEPEEAPQPEDIGFPADCLRPPGLIGDFIDYVLKTSKYPQPEHTLAGGLALMSLLAGRRVKDIGGTRGNLMIVNLGPTRSGKEWPRTVIKQLLEDVGHVKLFEEKIASEAALYGFLNVANSGLLLNDEFGDWLALARSKSGANTQPSRILTAMTMLYSSSNGRFKAPRYAENSKQIELIQPNLVFMGTSTGEVFWKHVTPEYLSGGLFGRVMIFENRGYVDPQPMAGRDIAMPDGLKTEVTEWLKFNAVIGDMAWVNPTPFIVPHSSDALDRFEGHELDISRRRKSEQAIKAALWSGTAEITAKLALLFSCSRSRNPLQITIEDVDRAITLSNWLTRRKFALCDDHVAENATEDASKRVYRLIKAAGKKGLEKRILTRKTQWMKDRDRQDILKDLIQADLIYCAEVTTKTNVKTVFLAS